MQENLKNAFDPEFQTQDLNSKIIVALERISEAFRVMLWEEAKKHQLSPIQIQILIFLHFHSPEKCKVSYLAQEFNLTKATISDAVKVLLAKELIYKENELTDSRSYTIQLSNQGRDIAKETANFSQKFQLVLNQFTNNQQAILFQNLWQFINELNQQNIITIQRMCLNCQFYEKKSENYYCHFLNKSLKDDELRVDCAEHQRKA